MLSQSPSGHQATDQDSDVPDMHRQFEHQDGQQDLGTKVFPLVKEESVNMK
jgi:hypothetical protein